MTFIFGLAAVSAQHWSYGWHPGKNGLLKKDSQCVLSGKKRSPNLDKIEDYQSLFDRPLPPIAQWIFVSCSYF